MSDQEMPQGTKPVEEHKWLENLLGEWEVTTLMNMGEGTEPMTGTGKEKVRSIGGLFAYSEGLGAMPGGDSFEYFCTIGYDVSFKEYRGVWFANMSSHLWRYVGEMSEDKRTLTLNCEGPDMQVDGKTANYRDVHHLVDENTRTMTSYGEMPDGTWTQFMQSTYRRIS